MEIRVHKYFLGVELVVGPYKSIVVQISVKCLVLDSRVPCLQSLSLELSHISDRKAVTVLGPTYLAICLVRLHHFVKCLNIICDFTGCSSVARMCLV